MKTLARMCALVGALSLGVSLSAQVAAGTPSNSAVSVDTQTMIDALKLRGDLSNAVLRGETDTDSAIARLRSANLPSGLQIDTDAGFAYAAIDVGQRLLVLRKPAEAEQFFLAAESSLAELVQRTDDTQAQGKAQFLRKLSYIRGNYLKEAPQALIDIDQAIALQPDDKGLQRAKAALAKFNAPISLPNSKG